MKRLNLETFIKKSIEKHSIDKYDYRFAIYTGCDIKCIIGCNTCGNIFEQTPYLHSKGSGCPKCANNIKLTTSKFIIRSNEIHKNVYNYSLVIYINNSTKVIIICPIHGEFNQTPASHLKGLGCNKCGLISLSKQLTKSVNYFIRKSNLTHNNKYDYSKSIYLNNSTPLIIICKKHGEFLQRPDSHYSGCGCPSCGYENISNFQIENTTSFINKSIIIHGNRYDYSEVNYLNNYTNVIILCSKHGRFSQQPSNHLSGRGCQNCSLSKGEIKIEKFLKENNILFESQKRFLTCRNILPLPFDFYLPDFNTLIEFQGEQHYKPFNFRSTKISGEENLKKIQTNDSIKSQWCLENNIRLLEIKYNENIEEKLKVLNE